MTDLENTLYETLRRVRNGGQSAVEIDSVLHAYEAQNEKYERFVHRRSISIQPANLAKAVCHKCGWIAGPDSDSRINELVELHLANI